MRVPEWIEIDRRLPAKLRRRDRLRRVRDTVVMWLVLLSPLILLLLMLLSAPAELEANR